MAKNTSGVNFDLLLIAQTPDKVHACDVHPTRPWVVSADDKENIVVWDYKNHAIALQFSLTSLEEDRDRTGKEKRMVDKGLDMILADSDTGRTRAAKPKNDAGDQEKKEKDKMGDIRQVRFFDDEVLRWALKDINNAPPPDDDDNEDDGNSRAPARWVVVVSENRVFVFDYKQQVTRDIKVHQLDNKQPTALEFTYFQPSLLLGCSDGSIRVWDVERWDTVKRLHGGHSKAVNKIICIKDSKGGMLPEIVTSGADGSICIWSLLSETLVGNFSKVHDGGVEDMTLNRKSGRLVSFGHDKMIGVFDVYNRVQIAKHKITGNAFTTICYYNNPLFQAEGIITGAKDPRLFFIETPNQLPESAEGIPPMREILDLTSVLPKQLVKVYRIVVHPLQPHIVMLATNQGIMVVSIEKFALPSFDYSNPRLKDREPGSLRHALDTHEIVCCNHCEVYTHSFKVVRRRDVGPGNTVDTSVKTIQKMKLESIADGDGGASVRYSPCGRYVSVVVNDSQKYFVYDTKGNRNLIDQGHGLNIVWSSSKTEARYAVYMMSHGGSAVNTSNGNSLSGGDRRSRRGDSVADRNSVNLSVPRSLGLVKIMRINPSSSMVEPVKDPVATKEPVAAIYGGHLLCVAYGAPPTEEFRQKKRRFSAKETKMQMAQRRMSQRLGKVTGRKESAEDQFIDANIANNQGRLCQFYDWEGKDVDGKFPEPHLVVWEHSSRWVAMAYHSELVIFIVRPKLKFLCSVRDCAISGVWAGGAFLYATTSEVCCVFPAAAECMPISLAAFTTPDTELSLDDNKKTKSRAWYRAPSAGQVLSEEPFLPPLQLRPSGSIGIIGVVGNELCVLDADFQIHLITLNHPSMKFCFAVAAGRTDIAAQWAKLIRREDHGLLAQFLSRRDHGYAALQLGGINLERKIEACIANAQYDDALEAARTETNPDGAIEACTLLSRAAHWAGRYDVANAALREAVRINPDAYMKLIAYDAEIGNNQELRDMFEQLKSSGYTDQARTVALLLNDHEMLQSVLEEHNLLAEAVLHSKSDSRLGHQTESLVQSWNAQLAVGTHDIPALKMIGPGDEKKMKLLMPGTGGYESKRPQARETIASSRGGMMLTWTEHKEPRRTSQEPGPAVQLPSTIVEESGQTPVTATVPVVEASSFLAPEPKVESESIPTVSLDDFVGSESKTSSNNPPLFGAQDMDFLAERDTKKSASSPATAAVSLDLNVPVFGTGSSDFLKNGSTTSKGAGASNSLGGSDLMSL